MMDQFLLKNLRGMDIVFLTDLLADQTEKYTRLLSQKQFTEEYEIIKQNINNIQIAIQEKINEE